MTNRLRSLINKIRNLRKNDSFNTIVIVLGILIGVIGSCVAMASLPYEVKACRSESEEWIKCGDHTLKKDAIVGVVATEKHSPTFEENEKHSENWSIVAALRSGGEVTVWVDDIETSLQTFKELETIDKEKR